SVTGVLLVHEQQVRLGVDQLAQRRRIALHGFVEQRAQRLLVNHETLGLDARETRERHTESRNLDAAVLKDGRWLRRRVRGSICGSPRHGPATQRAGRAYYGDRPRSLVHKPPVCSALRPAPWFSPAILPTRSDSVPVPHACWPKAWPKGTKERYHRARHGSLA